MENASKALIIAGAILISILLISVGVLIMNSTGDINEQVSSSADTMAIRTFNSQFLIYEGSNIKAAQVKELISLVRSSNASNDVEAGDAKYIEFATDSITKASTIASNKTYTVELSYGNEGYISSVKITENT